MRNSNESATLHAWWSLGILFALYLLGQIDRSVIFIVAGPLKSTLNLDPIQLGLILGPSLGVSYAIATYPLAMAADRIDRRLVVFLCVLVWVAGSIGGAFASSFAEMFLSRALVGVGEAALLPAAYVILSQLFPPRRLSLAFAILSMATIGGNALSFGIGGYILESLSADPGFFRLFARDPWQLVLITTALPCLIFAPLLFLIPAGRSEENREQGHSLLPHLRINKRAYLATILGFSFSAIGTLALLAWLPLYFQETFGWSPVRAGTVIAVVLVGAGTCGKLGSGLIVDAFFVRGVMDTHIRYLLFAIILCIPAMIAAFMVRSGAVSALLVAFWFLLVFPIGGYGPAALQLITPMELRGRISAVYVFTLNVVSTGLGPAGVGLLRSKVFTGQWGVGYALMATLLCCMTVSIVLLAQGLAPMRSAILAQRGSQEI